MSVNVGVVTPSATQLTPQRKLVKTSSGTLVLFSEPTNGHIQYKTSTDDGVNWSAWSSDVYNDVNLTTFDVYLDSNDDILVSWNYYYNNQSYIYFKRLTHQSGDTWSIGDLKTVTDRASVQYRNPVIAIRSNGDIWIVWGKTRSSYFYYSISTDNGDTWSAYAAVATSNEILSHCVLAKDSNIWVFTNTKPDLDLDLWEFNGASWSSLEIHGTVGYSNQGYISCLKISDSNIWLSVSTYYGIEVFHYTGSWDAGTLLTDCTLQKDDQPSITNINGNPVVVWRDYYDGGRRDIAYRVYNGSTWDAQENITTDDTNNSFPTTLPSSSGTLFIAWIKFTGNYDLYFDSVTFATEVTLTTEAVTDLQKTTATGNGTITDTGGVNATRRGFCYMVGTSGDPTTLDSTIFEDGDFGVGIYSLGLTGLTGQISYRVRAYAINSEGTGYGTTVQFKTVTSITITEPIQVVEDVTMARTFTLSDSLILSENWTPQISVEESIMHYRDFVQSYTYQNLNPPYHYETWYIENPVIGNSINRVLPSYFVGSIENVIIHCKDKGSSGETKVNVKLNGDSIFYHEADKPVIPFNASKEYDHSNEPYLKLIGKNDLLTVDIESVAVGATGLTVNVAISQTSVPISVQKIEAIDENGFVYSGTDILGSNTLYFKVYFSTSFLFPPSIQIIDDEGNTANLELDTISTTTSSNDTIITQSIDTSDYAGNYTLIVKNASSATGVLQDSYEKLYLFSDEDILDYLDYNRYSNSAEVDITILNLTIFKSSISSFSYSLNNTDWTVDTDFTNPFTIDITDNTVGGSTVEEDKTIYLRFKNEEGSGYLATTITIGYYYSAISFDASYVVHNSCICVINYDLPATATTVPLRGLDIYDGSTLLKSLTFENLPLSDFDVTSTWEVGNSRFKIDVDTGYITGSKGDALYGVSASTFYIDQPTDNLEELHLVMIEIDTNNIVCQEVLTRALDTAKYYEGSYDYKSITYDDFISIVDTYKEDYIVLYGVHVIRLNNESVLYNYVRNYTLVAVSVTSTSLDLSAKITDQAGRVYTNDMTDLTKNNRMKISVHLSKDPDSNAVSDTLENATIINELPDNFYVTGEYLDE